MRVEFPQGIPNQCFEWLLENVGPGNVYKSVSGRYLFNDSKNTDAWFYSSVSQPVMERCATITIKNPKLATFFILRWS